MNIRKIWRAGFTRRWHRNSYMADTIDPVNGHSGRVATLLVSMFPDASRESIIYALIHDLGEAAVGDMDGEAKRQNPALAAMLGQMEADAMDEMGLRIPALTAIDKQRVDFCDKLDAYLWVKHHKPHLLAGDGWPEARKALNERANALGVYGKMLEGLG